MHFFGTRKGKKDKMKFLKDKQHLELTEGSIPKGLISFATPLFLGNLLQQFYNMADAWVIGNYADNDAFAAVSSAGSICFLIIGLFGGISIGGGVVISKYYGAKDEENVQKAIHTNFLFGIIASVIATVLGLILIPNILQWMQIPESVMPHSLLYFRIYFGGVATIIMYNICMSIMRALGDSLHPLYYLLLSSVVNIALDLLFVIGFKWGVSGAAIATVIAQGLSVLLCVIQLCRKTDYTKLCFNKLKLYPGIAKQVITQGLPAGIQNSVISIGNIVVQSNINTFGAFAMSGYGAYAKIEGLVFLPITSMAMALPTFVSQNLGAGKIGRAKKGSKIGITSGVLCAELIGFLIFFWGKDAMSFFVDSPEALHFGEIQSDVVSWFFCLLAFSHCCAGVLRGCGKSFIPMLTMLAFWCGVRIIYVTTTLKFVNEFVVISWAYPLTWFLSSVVFAIVLIKNDWESCFLKG